MEKKMKAKHNHRKSELNKFNGIPKHTTSEIKNLRTVIQKSGIPTDIIYYCRGCSGFTVMFYFDQDAINFINIVKKSIIFRSSHIDERSNDEGRIECIPITQNSEIDLKQNKAHKYVDFVYSVTIPKTKLKVAKNEISKYIGRRKK